MWPIYLSIRSDGYGSHGGSLFCTGIKFDSQIFSSAAQDLSSFSVEFNSSGNELKSCASNLIPVQKSELPWLP